MHCVKTQPSKATNRSALSTFYYKAAVFVCAATALALTSCQNPVNKLDSTKKGTPITPDSSVVLVDRQSGKMPNGINFSEQKSYLFRIKGRGDTILSFDETVCDVIVKGAGKDFVLLHPLNDTAWTGKSLHPIAEKCFDRNGGEAFRNSDGGRGGLLFTDSNGVKVVIKKISRWNGDVMLTFSTPDGTTEDVRALNSLEVDFAGTKYCIFVDNLDRGSKKRITLSK